MIVGFLKHQEQHTGLPRLPQTSIGKLHRKHDSCWWFRNPVNSPVEGKVVEIYHYLQGLINTQTVVGLGISEPPSTVHLRRWFHFLQRFCYSHFFRKHPIWLIVFLLKRVVPPPTRFDFLGGWSQFSQLAAHHSEALNPPNHQHPGDFSHPPGTLSIHFKMVVSIGWFQNHYMKNGCFTKHPLKNGCLGFQAKIISFIVTKSEFWWYPRSQLGVFSSFCSSWEYARDAPPQCQAPLPENKAVVMIYRYL